MLETIIYSSHIWQNGEGVVIFKHVVTRYQAVWWSKRKWWKFLYFRICLNFTSLEDCCSPPLTNIFYIFWAWDPKTIFSIPGIDWLGVTIWNRKSNSYWSLIKYQGCDLILGGTSPSFNIPSHLEETHYFWKTVLFDLILSFSFLETWLRVVFYTSLIVQYLMFNSPWPI